MERFRELQFGHDQRVTGFVVSGDLFVAFVHRATAAFPAPAHFVARFFQLFQINSLLAVAGSQQCGFVDEIGEVSPGEAGRAARDDFEIHVLRKLHVPDVHFENFLPAHKVRQVDDDLPVKPTGS